MKRNIMFFSFFLLIIILIINLDKKVEYEKPETKEQTKTQEQQEQEIYNDIIKADTFEEQVAKERIYFLESGFSNEYVLEAAYSTNPESGKVGICQLAESYKYSIQEQNIKCTEYMEKRYGTWEKALEFWNKNNWW